MLWIRDSSDDTALARRPQIGVALSRFGCGAVSLLGVGTPQRDDDPGWEEIAASQDQVLSRSQARAGGLSEDAWQWRLDKGVWQPLTPGIAVLHSGEATHRQRGWAGVLRGGAGSALSADAALVEQGFRLKDLRTVDVAVPEGRAGVSLPLLGEPRYEPHHVRHLAGMVHPARALPMVRAETAVLHAAAWAKSDKAAEWRLAAVVQQGLVKVPAIRSALSTLPKLRRRALVRAVLDDVELGAHAASELDFLRLCRRNKLPVPDELQLRVRLGKLMYLDARYRRQKVSVEVDGAHHRLVEQWEADVMRASRLAVAARGTGEVQLRFTAGNLRHEEADVVQLLRAALT